MLPSIVKTREAISHERLFQNQYSNTPWNWNGKSRNKACSLLNAVLKFPFLITQVTAMKNLSFVKPLSIRLQKQDDVYEANCQVDDLEGDLKLS